MDINDLQQQLLEHQAEIARLRDITEQQQAQITQNPTQPVFHHTVSTDKYKSTLSKTLRAQLVQYDGSRNAVLLDNYCRRLELFFRHEPMPDEAQVVFASSLLTKTAEAWIATWPADSFATFADFKESLSLRFRPADAVREARTLLSNLRQRGSTRAYLAQF